MTSLDDGLACKLQRSDVCYDSRQLRCHATSYQAGKVAAAWCLQTLLLTLTQIGHSKRTSDRSTIGGLITWHRKHVWTVMSSWTGTEGGPMLYSSCSAAWAAMVCCAQDGATIHTAAMTFSGPQFVWLL